MQVSELWNSHDESVWLIAQEKYWNLVRPSNQDLERELENLDSASVAQLSEEQFYNFLYNQCFVWKYTAPNRLATTRKALKEYEGDMEALKAIQARLFSFDLENIKRGLTIAKEIKGLGVAGSSGLLAVLFPKYFGTVDQFAVKTLKKLDNLEERSAIQQMNEMGLTISNGEILIKIMRSKAAYLNTQFHTDYWTPRKIDKILWAIER